VATKIFVNLPVKSLNKSVEFFTKLGFKFNPQFTDDTATCMIVTDDIFVMLLTEPKFKSFTPTKFAMQRRAPKCWWLSRARAEQKSMKWSARPSPPAEQLTTNHKTTVLCTDMGFRTWMAISGN
jgi:hypothetical protein